MMEEEEERLKQESEREFKIKVVKFELATGRNNESFDEPPPARKSEE